MIRRIICVIVFKILMLQGHILEAKEITIDNTFTYLELHNGLNKQPLSSFNNDSLKLILVNTTNNKQQLYISIINPNLDQIEIIDRGAIHHLGDLIKFSKRIFKHVNHVYPIQLNNKENRNLSIVIKKNETNNNFRIVLSSENNFIKTTNHDNFFIGIFFGILFTYILLFICLYIFSRSRLYLNYLSVNIFMILFYLQYTGIGNQYIWFYSASIQNFIPIIIAVGYLGSHFIFVRSFFSFQYTKNTSGYILLLFLFAIITFTSISIISFYFPRIFKINNTTLSYLLNIIFLGYGIIILLISGHSYINTKRRESIWILSGTLIHMLSWALFINNNSGAISYLNLLNNLKLFHSHLFISQINFYLTTTEIIMISVFISVNYYKLINDNNISIQKLEQLQIRNIKRFVVGQEEEREIISRDITDVILSDINNLSKSISKLHIENDNITTLPSIIKDIDKTVQDIKDISINYIAPDIQKMSLQEVLLTSTYKLNDTLKTNYIADNKIHEIHLSAIANINLYRMLQEISNNIIKHAKANLVELKVIIDEKNILIEISDNGIGFNMESNANGIGLLNIESRIQSINGVVKIRSTKGKGTTIQITLPIKGN